MASQPCPDEEGIKTAHDIQYTGIVRPSHALMKKGLRLSAAVVSDEHPCPSHALMKKGLRRVGTGIRYDYGGSQPCPDEEGIKT